MKHHTVSIVALIASLGLAGVAYGQGRHDERPHGYDKAKAEASAPAKVDVPPAAGGRHDEKPHNAKVTATAKKPEGKAAPAPAAAAKPAE